MNKKVYYIIFPLFFTIIVFYSAIYTTLINPCRESNHTEERWGKCIQSEGVEKAYEYFKKENKSAPVSQKHMNAHIFSGALFTTVGIVGIATCDDSYGGGCFHEIISRTFIQKGKESLTNIARVCQKLNPSGYNKNCLHGFGHGLVALLGYEEKDLLQALAFCSNNFPYKKEEYGNDYGSECYLGAFMEYNERTFLQSEFSEPRILDMSNVYAPCDSLLNEYKKGCYYKLAKFWPSRISEKDMVKKYHTASLWCDKVPDEEFKYACISGLSLSIALQDSLDLEERINICETIFTKQEDRLQCQGKVYDKYENPL